jgi:plastocyanin
MRLRNTSSFLLVNALIALPPFLLGQSSHPARSLEVQSFAKQFPKSGRATTAGQTVGVTVGPSGSFTFSPSVVNISVGDTVQWTWGSSNHSTTSGNCCTADNKFCSPNDTNCPTAPLSISGTIYSHTFTQAGSYPYFCKAHGGFGMTGVINVAVPPLTITAVSRPGSGASSGHFIITGKTNPSLSVSILAAPDWATQFGNIGTAQADANGVFQYDDSAAVNLTTRFYRASYP